MTTKQIIDAHFVSNYNYYKRICYRYCRGSVIHEDLLHKTYEKFLEVKEEVILKFHKLNRLYNLGLRIIRSLYQKRNQLKKNKQSSTSELAMVSGNFDISDYVVFASHWIDEDSEFRISNTVLKILSLIEVNKTDYTEIDFLDLEKSINELLIDPDKTVGVTIFLQASEISINELHRNSGISRYYLTEKYNEGLNNLKTHIQNEQRNNIKRASESHRSEPREIQILDKEKRTVAA